jgi:hypothetical protein
MIRTIATALALLWTAPVETEKVEVGGRGAVDLAPFACADTPRSTIVQKVCYDGTSRDLLVGIGGSYRGYCDVSPAAFNAFMTAPSMGHFYRQSIATSGVDGPFNCFSPRASQKMKRPHAR